MARSGRLLAAAKGDGAVAVGLMVGNVLGYVLALVAARRLGPASFGELSALLAVIVVLAVIPTGVQTVVARAVAQHADHPLVALGRTDVATRSALLSVLMVPPVLSLGLALDASWLASVFAALLVGPLLVLGWAQGIEQGREKFGALAMLLLLNNGGRAVGAVLGVIAWDSVPGALGGALAAAVLAAAYAWITAGDEEHPRGRHRGWGAGDVGRASAALLALFLCTNVDVLLARTVLAAEPAGIYAAGAVMAKVAFWLPQFAAVTALPRLADPDRRDSALRVSTGIVIVSSALIVLACVVGREPVVRAIGGAEYGALTGALPWFAVAGGLWALNQVYLYDALARRAGHPARWLWAALIAMVGLVLVLGVDSVRGVVITVCGCAAASFMAYLVQSSRLPGQVVVPGHSPGL
ncbi:MAG TPA: oligosaccharide flippase family protein [Dermatophilaceae bacterium]|nr:oligosaccharide flippase family protein [Dermatophilaceae bacterium]